MHVTIGVVKQIPHVTVETPSSVNLRNEES
jgi:hypothetical protein